MIRLEKDDCLNIIRRLIAAMQLGVRISDQDGHRWLEAIVKDDLGDSLLEESRFSCLLREKKVSVNNKIYGSFLEALQVIDDALQLAGEPSLLERYLQRFQESEESEVFYPPNPEHERVSRAEVEGGLS